MSRGMSAPALWLLGHLAHRNEPLAGDLVEQFRDGRSSAWLWAQILCAIAMGEFRHPHVPVALNLTPIDPIVAEWLVSRRLTPRRVTSEQPGGRRRRPRADDAGISSEHRGAGRLVVRDWRNRLRPCARDDACLPAPAPADGDRWTDSHRTVKRPVRLKNEKRKRKPNRALAPRRFSFSFSLLCLRFQQSQRFPLPTSALGARARR